MANNIPGRQQLALAVNFVKTRPIRSGILLLAIALMVLVTYKHEPIVIKYSAHYGDPRREIETFVLVNPNVEKRDIIFSFSPSGDVQEFSADDLDDAVAMDLSGKNLRTAKLSLLQRSVSIVSIVRDKLDHGAVKIIPGPVEMEPSSSMMRSIAIAYVVSLLLLLTGFLSGISSAVGALSFLSNPRDLIDKVRKAFHSEAGHEG
jgi:hypothetical protein